MENFSSQSCRNMATRSTKASGMQDLRSYSTSYAKSLPPVQVENDGKINRGKGNFGSTKSWVFSDPELQRKQRVASYKGYTLEGRVKGSIGKGFRWVKDSYNQVVHGWK